MIVMKFGGTSVADATAIGRLADAVTRAAPEAPLVVVSALSGMTDTLLRLEPLDPASRGAAIDTLALRHHDVARELGVAAEVAVELESRLTTLRALLAGSGAGAWSPETRDGMVATGELLSSCLVAAALRARGLPARWFDAREVIRTDHRFGAAIPDAKAIGDLAARLLAPHLDAGDLVVTQGFIGSTADGRGTTLGRGGSDFTAALLGAALAAERVEIWTDVDGLMTADPRLVADARLLTHATYDEAAELAAFGAKVLHPATQLPLSDAAIPIVIRNTFAPARPGTRVVEDAPVADDTPIRSIAFKRGATIVRIRAARMLGAFGFLRRIFEVFERHEIVVDVLASSEVSVSLTVDHSPRLLAAAEDLRAIGDVSVQPGYGIVSLVGRGLRDTPGISARAFSAIADVNVEMTSQGASASNLTFLVREEEGPRVVRALHATFFPAVA